MALARAHLVAEVERQRLLRRAARAARACPRRRAPASRSGRPGPRATPPRLSGSVAAVRPVASASRSTSDGVGRAERRRRRTASAARGGRSRTARRRRCRAGAARPRCAAHVAKPKACAKRSAAARSGFSNSSQARSRTLMTGLRARPGCSPAQGALLAVQVVVGPVLGGHRLAPLEVTDEIVTYDDSAQSRASDEIVNTELDRRYTGVTRPTGEESHDRRHRAGGRTAWNDARRAPARRSSARRRPSSPTGRPNVPVLEITQAADVGMGSFYNHFDSKEELFEAAVEDVLDAYGALLDELTADVDDPAEVFARSFRLTGRLHRREPELSQVLLNNGLRLLSADNGLAPRARRDIDAAVEAGRFTVDDLDLAVTMAAGALLASANCCTTSPTATTPRPPTRSPRTCCACSACPAGRPRHLHPAAARPRGGAGQRLSGLSRHPGRAVCPVRSNYPAGRLSPATSSARCRRGVRRGRESAHTPARHTPRRHPPVWPGLGP